MDTHQQNALNKRIRNAEKQRVPMIVVLGDKEVEERTVAIRDRRTREQSTVSIDEFMKIIREKLSEGSI